MVQTFGQNAAGDIYIGADGNLIVLKGIDAVAAATVTACRAQFGEMALATQQGLPNFSLIWNGTPDYALWQSYLQNTILNVEGVTQVYSITLTAQNNILSYIAQIETIYGPTTINGAING